MPEFQGVTKHKINQFVRIVISYDFAQTNHDKICRTGNQIAGTTVRPSATPDDFLVNLGVEADHQRFSFPHGGGSKISRWPQHQLGQRGRIGHFIREIEMDDPFPLGDVKISYAIEQRQGRVAIESFFFRVDFFLGINARVRKKLLRFSARLSARSMVTPVDFRHFSAFLKRFLSAWFRGATWT